MGGEGLPACLGSLASEGTWGLLPSAPPELRVGSVTGAELTLAGISEQVASQLAKGKPWARGVPGGHPGQQLSRCASARLPACSRPLGHLVLPIPGPAQTIVHPPYRPIISS